MLKIESIDSRGNSVDSIAIVAYVATVDYPKIFGCDLIEFGAKGNGHPDILVMAVRLVGL